MICPRFTQSDFVITNAPAFCVFVAAEEIERDGDRRMPHTLHYWVNTKHVESLRRYTFHWPKLEQWRLKQTIAHPTVRCVAWPSRRFQATG